MSAKLLRRVRLALLAIVLLGTATAYSWDRDERLDNRDRRRREEDRRRDRDSRRGDGRLRAGDRVWTIQGAPGVVRGTFPDGRVAVEIHSAVYNYLRADLATEGCNQYACSRDGVWTAQGAQGEVNGFFPNGLYSVRIHGANYRYAVDQIATQGCLQDYCSADAVISIQGAQGVINGIFYAGAAPSASVKINGANYRFLLSDLAQIREPAPRDPQARPDRFPASGERVWTLQGAEGVVNGSFSDGRVSVKIHGANYTYAREALALDGCYRRLCSGDSVVLNTGSPGVVNAFFLDTRVSVKIHGANYTVSREQIAR